LENERGHGVGGVIYGALVDLSGLSENKSSTGQLGPNKGNIKVLEQKGNVPL
jgi:hypothetical protein